MNASLRLRSIVESPRAIPLVAAIAAWLAVCYGIWHSAIEHSLTPGEGVVAMPDRWPADGAVDRAIERAGDRPTLVLCMHPRCPCTAASIETLGPVCIAAGNSPKVVLLVKIPPAAGSEWLETDGVRAARELPGAEVVADCGGELARRFGAATSGTVFLFSPSGECLFGGGVTASRGHAGENAGLQMLRQAFATGEPAGGAASPVFGCPLYEPPRISIASGGGVEVKYDR